MSIFESFTLAIRTIFASKLRSFLTMLGIIIGVSAVIVIVGLGNGMQEYTAQSFSEMGTDVLTVQVGGRGSSTRTVDVDGMYEIVEAEPEHFTALSPTVYLSGGVKIGRETLDTTPATGVSESYLAMKQYEVEEGRGLRYVDMVNRTHSCVIGRYVADTYYGGNAVGQDIRIGGNTFHIVGVLAQSADEMESGGSDDGIYVPYSTAARLTGTKPSAFTVQLADEETASASKQVLEAALYEVFENEDAYSVMSLSELLSMITGMQTVIVTILAIIAGISLVVGGIGIMNIMLVSVSERTREIGIRKALGAKERTILTQFVIEAATTSAMGGFIGILLGYGLSAVGSVIIVQLLGEDMHIVPTLSAVATAFLVSATIGVVFGYLPARKAARLNPIDALRYE